MSQNNAVHMEFLRTSLSLNFRIVLHRSCYQTRKMSDKFWI